MALHRLSRAAFLLLAGASWVVACGSVAPTTSAPDLPDSAVDATAHDAGAPDGSAPDAEASSPEGGPPADGGAATTLVHVPSSAAAAAGVAVQISTPSIARFRSGKAPVAIVIAGGWGADGLTAAAPYTLESLGFVVLTFNFPGGGTGPTASGGAFDTRGADSVAATRDVVRFALGTLADTGGKRLRDHAPSASPGNVGLVGLSNGGNMTLLTLGAHGADVPGVRWVVNWESPVGDAAPNAEAGVKGGPQNPAYDDATGLFDYTRLAFDPALNVVRQGPPRLGGYFWDMNGDGSFGPGDFRSFPLADVRSTKVYDSVGLSAAAAARGLAPTPAPPHLATAAETAAFWATREASSWIPSVVAKVPGLLFTVEASVEDHVQVAADYPHVFAQYDALRTHGGKLVRLCADRAYVEAIGGRPFPAAVDNDANTAFTRATLRGAVNPESVPTNLAVRSAVAELADRAETGNLAPNLSGLLGP